MTKMRAPLIMALCFALGMSAQAADTQGKFTAVDLTPIQHKTASLTIQSLDGRTLTFSPGELEQLGSYRLETTTPWRPEPAVFEGPLLTDVLAAAGLEDAASIQVVAENDYAVTVEQEVWQDAPILVATRVNGAAHSRRERGPIQFVMHMDDFEASAIAGERHWVWMAATIQAE